MRTAWVAGLAGLVLAGVAVAVPALHTTPAPPPVVVSTPSPAPFRTPLLTAARAGGLPTTDGLRAVLAQALHDRALGHRVSFSLVDARTGAPLFDLSGDREVTPASTAKLATAVAALTALPADRRFTTRVLQGSAGAVVLVGGGDPSLSAAGLAALAAQVKKTGTPVRRVLVDDTLFTGLRLGPGWKPAYVRQGNVAPVSALSVDGGRTSKKEGRPRVDDPALAAGRQLAKLLGLSSAVRGQAPAKAASLARVTSLPLSRLVAQMLTHSDNDVAEALGRQVALATGHPASFEGEAAAIAQVLARVKVPVGLVDASGLSPLDRVRPSAVTALLALAVRNARFAPFLDGLPVAGFDGTLDDRFRSGPQRAAAGLVRAKTGTLEGVSALAGLVRTQDGGLLAFDLTVDGLGTRSAHAAEAAMERVVALLATCGCRQPVR